MSGKNMVRVFLSSTFADMKEERSLFNTVIAPELKKLCANRGISFFGVDLRWGITEEDQEKGRVLPICLREIDNCRPFFIGILGNRYGSEVETVTAEQVKAIPWLEGRAGRSVTELEMLYGVLESPKAEKENSAFFFRSPEYSRTVEEREKILPEPEEKREKLEGLKERVRGAKDISQYDYHSPEEFQAKVTEVFQRWLDQEFPPTADIARARKEWYDREIIRNFIDATDGMSADPGDGLTVGGSEATILGGYLNATPRLLIGGGEQNYSRSGKTTYMTKWAPTKGKKYLINCGAVEAYRDWPEVVREIIFQLEKADCSGEVPPQWDGKEESLEAFLEGFLTWLGKVEVKEPTYLVINDINLLENGKGAELIAWLNRLKWREKDKRDEKLHVICTANTKEIRNAAEEQGWELLDFPELQDEERKVGEDENGNPVWKKVKGGVLFFENYIGNFGKGVAPTVEENLSSTKFIDYPGYLKFIGDYFINYADFSDLDKRSAEIARIAEKAKKKEKEAVPALYLHVWKKMAIHWGMMRKKGKDTPEWKYTKEGRLAKKAFYILAVTELGLYEEELYSLVFPKGEENQLLWAKIRAMLEQYGAIGNEMWKIDDPALVTMVKEFRGDQKEEREVHRRLGTFFETKAAQAEGRQKRRYTEAARRHKAAAERNR